MRWNLSLKIPIEFAPALAANLPKSVGKPTTTKNRSFDFDPKKKCEKKTFDTRDSRVVPHRSTDRAQWCLTAQFGWDAVYPPWCDRMMGPLFL